MPYEGAICTCFTVQRGMLRLNVHLGGTVSTLAACCSWCIALARSGGGGEGGLRDFLTRSWQRQHAAAGANLTARLQHSHRKEQHTR